MVLDAEQQEAGWAYPVSRNPRLFNVFRRGNSGCRPERNAARPQNRAGVNMETTPRPMPGYFCIKVTWLATHFQAGPCLIQVSVKRPRCR